MTGALEFTILGCGSSAGVPRADGNWGVCDPTDPRNSRSRCSLLVRRSSREGAEHETTVLVDTSPDLRLQTAGAGVKRLDAVLFTHDHADQTHGLDDVRAFAQQHGIDPEIRLCRICFRMRLHHRAVNGLEFRPRGLERCARSQSAEQLRHPVDAARHHGCRKVQDRNSRRRFVRLNLFAHRKAGNIGQIHIKDYQIRKPRHAHA